MNAEISNGCADQRHNHTQYHFQRPGFLLRRHADAGKSLARSRCGYAQAGVQSRRRRHWRRRWRAWRGGCVRCRRDGDELAARRAIGLHSGATIVANDVLAAVRAGKFEIGHNKLIAGVRIGSQQANSLSGKIASASSLSRNEAADVKVALLYRRLATRESSERWRNGGLPTASRRHSRQTVCATSSRRILS